MHHQKLSRYLLSLLLTGALLLTACKSGMGSKPTLIPGTPQAQVPTAMPTYTPTPAVLGSEARPLQIAYVSKNPSEAQIAALNQVADDLSGTLGLSVKAQTFSDYASLELALQKKQLHLVWLQPAEYLLASEKGLASSLLVSNHMGVTAYGVQFIAHKDGNFTSFYDADSHSSTAKPETALQQFAGLRPCLTDRHSLTGYWVPLAYLAKNNIATLPAVQTYSYSGAMRALYIKGVCGFTASYSISADPRTSSELITDLRDALEKLPIIWISPPIIPNLSLSVSGDIDLALQTRISEFLRSYSRQNDGKAKLSEALAYEVASLEPLPDSAYESLRDLLDYTDIRLSDLVP